MFFFDKFTQPTSWSTTGPFDHCSFTYVSLLLGLLYLGLFLFSSGLLWKLLQQYKRRPQKVFLTLLSIHSGLRAAYFLLWPFFGNSCIPGLRKSTNIYYMEILGTFPVLFFVASFSLYVLTIGRVNLLFQLHFNHDNSPKCIIYFYRTLVGLVVFFNISSTTFTILDITISDNNQFWKSISLNGALFAITGGSVIVAIAFVYIVVSLYNTIEREIIAPLRQQEQEQINQQQEQFLPHPHQHHQHINQQPNDFYANANNQLTSSNSIFSYHYDGDMNTRTPNTPTRSGGVGGGSGMLSNDLNSPLLHSSISSTFGQSREHFEEQLTQQQSQSFSYGYQGRLALNPYKNPMRHLYVVSVVSCLSLIAKALLLVVLNYLLDFDTEKDQNNSILTGLLAVYFIVSELLPSVACLISFNVVAAPTSQWRYTYAHDDNTEVNVLGNVNLRASGTTNQSNQNNNKNVHGMSQIDDYDDDNDSGIHNFRIRSDHGSGNNRSRKNFDDGNMIIDANVTVGSINQFRTSTNTQSSTRNNLSSQNTSQHTSPNLPPQQQSTQQQTGYHMTVDGLVNARQQQSQPQQQQQKQQFYTIPHLPQQQQQQQQQEQQQQHGAPSSISSLTGAVPTIPTTPTHSNSITNTSFSSSGNTTGTNQSNQIKRTTNNNITNQTFSSPRTIKNFSSSQTSTASPIGLSLADTSLLTASVLPSSHNYNQYNSQPQSHHYANTNLQQQHQQQQYHTNSQPGSMMDQPQHGSSMNDTTGGPNDINNTRSPGRRRTGKHG